MQLLKKEEDAGLLDRFEAKREEWAEHWQCDESVQKVKDKRWKMRIWRGLEEALPRLKDRTGM